MTALKKYQRLEAPGLWRERPGAQARDFEAMGFSWATPTTFDDPMFTVGGRVNYYAVDHSPSYLWNSATWENSEALMPFVETVMSGR